MKKTLIAGAASAVLAAMPIVGVFADNYPVQVQDDLTITIQDSCTMASSHRTNTGTEQAPVYNDDHTFAATMLAGTRTELGSTTITVSCNLPSGFTLNASFDDLTNDKVAAHTIPYSSDTDTAADGTKVWNAVLSGTATGIATAGKIADNSNILAPTTQTPAGGSAATITYSVSTANNQASGTYSGNATYVLSGTAAAAGA